MLPGIWLATHGGYTQPDDRRHMMVLPFRKPVDLTDVDVLASQRWYQMTVQCSHDQKKINKTSCRD